MTRLTSDAATTATSRLVSMLTGVLVATLGLASFSGLEYTTKLPSSLQRTAVAVATPPAITPRPATKWSIDQGTVASYLVREWQLGRGYASQVASAMLTAAKRHGLDPLLLMAVAATESSFKHWVGNPGGGADPMKPFGIMQVAGRYHAEKFPGGTVKQTTVRENVDLGARVLKEYLRHEQGNVKRALLRYNGSLAISDKYFRKVSKVKRSLHQGIQDQRRRAGES